MHVLLSILFNVMLQHGYNANDLILSSIISTPKDMKSSLSSSTNYRGISLFNAIGKVFDYAILLISNTCFQTSDMQFGFKQQHSIFIIYFFTRKNLFNKNSTKKKKKKKLL